MLVTSNSFCLIFQTSQLEIFIQAFYIPSRQNCLCQMSTEQKVLAHLMWTELIPITWWHSWYVPVSLSPHYDCIWSGAKWAPGHQQRRALCRPSQVNSVTQSPECEGDIGSVASWVEWCFVFLSEARNLHLVCEEFKLTFWQKQHPRRSWSMLYLKVVNVVLIASVKPVFGPRLNECQHAIFNFI